MLALGASLNAVSVWESSLAFAVDHAEAVLATEGMERIAAQRPDLLVQLFAAAKLGVSESGLLRKTSWRQSAADPTNSTNHSNTR